MMAEPTIASPSRPEAGTRIQTDGAIAKLAVFDRFDGLRQTTGESVIDGSLLSVRIWGQHSPWRLAAAWAVLAAALSASVPFSWADVDWRTLLLLLVLTDPVWGSIWGLAAGRDGLLQVAQTGGHPRIWLPYLHPGSPAARLFGWEGRNPLSLLFQVALPSILMAGLVALILGELALAWTALIVALSVLGWLGQRVRPIPTLFLHSLVAVALPWSLTLVYLGDASSGRWAYQIVLLSLWTTHAWGGARVLHHSGDQVGLVLLAVAQLGISLLLVFVRAPLWLALINVLWLPTWLAVYKNRSLQRAQIWWLASMLISGLAMGQSA